ncbi:hypothetical protein BJX76DRAFT_94549 [Aspergillus varians]
MAVVLNLIITLPCQIGLYCLLLTIAFIASVGGAPDEAPIETLGSLPPLTACPALESRSDSTSIHMIGHSTSVNTTCSVRSKYLHRSSVISSPLPVRERQVFFNGIRHFFVRDIRSCLPLVGTSIHPNARYSVFHFSSLQTLLPISPHNGQDQATSFWR